MAEILGIITGVFTAGQMLETFGHQTRKWGRLSERLFDIREELFIAEVALRNWKRKYRIDNQPAEIKNRMLRVLFGRSGSEQIVLILGSIASLIKIVRGDIKRLVGRALQARPGWKPGSETDSDFDERLVEDCLDRIRTNTSWSRKFAWSVFGKADELERKVNRLDLKVGKLERLSDLLLEAEHPGIFEAMKRLPGRKHIPKISDGADGASKHVRLQRFAELLHKASNSPRSRVHIGLSVPQTDSRDFDFLLNLHGESHEVLARPVKFKSGRTVPGVKSDFSAAVPVLHNNAETDSSLLVRPSSASSDGFKVFPAQHSHLLDLEHKESLASIITAQNSTTLGSQLLYLQDQNAIASGIARGSLRLIGSPWLDFLDSTNVRWRRSRDGGEWTTMLTAQAGNASITRELEKCLTANRDTSRRDLAKHVQIFRIGLVIAEVALKQPISYVDFDAHWNVVRMYINTHEEVDAAELAALVDRKANVYVGNMVLFCLGALQDKERMRDREIEEGYYRDVLKDAKDLEGLVKRTGGKGEKSPVRVRV